MSETEKRSVHTDALATLGTIIDETAERDAIHLAVYPIIAGQNLEPGDDVGIHAGRAFTYVKPVGIVDPFLRAGVKAGEWFWLIVYPRQITSLRHVWEHPAFPSSTPPAPTQGSWEFISNTASKVGISVGSLMSALDYYVANVDPKDPNRMICFGEEIESRELPDGFWQHYEAVTGNKVAEEFREVYFRCGC